jgi:hypothetical protein
LGNSLVAERLAISQGLSFMELVSYAEDIRQNAECFNVKAGGTYSNHLVLKGLNAIQMLFIS